MTSEFDVLQSAFDALPLALDAAFAIIALASAIAALTVTPRDDQFWGRAYSVIEFFALNIGHAKQVPPNRDGGRFIPD